MAIGQALLLHGVDLPDLMGRRPPAAVLRGRPHGRAIDAGPTEPALQGPLRGQRAVGPLLLEWEADEDGAPGGMVTLQPAGGADQTGVAPRLGSAAAWVIRRQRVGSPVADATPELANRHEGDVKFLGDGSERVSLLAALDDRLTNRDGDGLGHGNPPVLQEPGG
jgi:hypothetical protein